MAKRKCKCHEHERQVCDICQGVKHKKQSGGLSTVTMTITCKTEHGMNVRRALFDWYYMIQSLNPQNIVGGCRISDPKKRKA